MYEQVKFDGKGYAWGRNGRFVPKEADVLKFNTGEVELTVNSKRSGNRSPMVLRLSGADAVCFANKILKAASRGGR